MRYRAKNPHVLFYLVVTGCVVLLSGAFWAFSTIPLELCYIAGVNIVAFFLMGYDKLAARSGGSRVPEQLLVSTAIAGGCGGFLAGMYRFRHKTRKVSFQASLIVLLIVELGLFYFVKKFLIS